MMGIDYMMIDIVIDDSISNGWLIHSISTIDLCDPSHSIHFNTESIASDATLLFSIEIHLDFVE